MMMILWLFDIAVISAVRRFSEARGEFKNIFYMIYFNNNNIYITLKSFELLHKRFSKFSSPKFYKIKFLNHEQKI